MGIAMNYQTLKVTYQQAVQRIQIYRPEANNSINSQMISELSFALQAVEDEEKTRVLVLEGLPDVFCTGMDFEEITRGKTEKVDHEASFNGYYNILKQISQSNKVTVSLVQGKVQAGGVGLVAASDLVIAGPNATFVLSELLFGLLPACVLPFLIRRVGFQKAYRLAITTQSISITDAYNWGLVDEYDDNTDMLLSKYIRRLKCLPASGVKELKEYIKDLWVIQEETQHLAVNKASSLIIDPSVQEKLKALKKEGIL